MVIVAVRSTPGARHVSMQWCESPRAVRWKMARPVLLGCVACGGA
jgi:hypothetical protein